MPPVILVGFVSMLNCKIIQCFEQCAVTHELNGYELQSIKDCESMYNAIEGCIAVNWVRHALSRAIWSDDARWGSIA